MNVLYFHQHFSTPQGPGGQRSYEMAKRLITRGHCVTMVCGHYKGSHTGLSHPFKNGVRQGEVDGIRVIEFDLPYSNYDGFLKRTWIFLKFAWLSVRCIWTESYDVVFASSTPLTASIPGILARWFRRKPFVFEVRDLWPELPKAMGVITNPIILWLMGQLEKWSYLSAHALIGLSPGMVQGIKNKSSTKKDVFMIPNGCDLELFDNPKLMERPEGVNATDLMLLYTGTHGMANGLNAVLEVALVLKQRGIAGIKFVLVGDGKLKPNLKERAQKEQLESIIFLDSIPKSQIPNLMASADIGMQLLANVPAFYDGTSPNKFFDYLAVGLPVLINYPGWLAEKIKDSDSGFVVPPEDPDAFADVLQEIQLNREQLQHKKENAKCLARAEFDRATLSEQWADILESVCFGSKIKRQPVL